MPALLRRSPLSPLQWAINLWGCQSECVSALRLKEDRMRSNAEMANFMASVNQTRLQLDLDSGHLRANSSPIRSKWRNGQPSCAHGGIPNNLRQLLCNSLTCSKGPEPCNVSFVQVVYTRCCSCCCSCRAAVVPFLMLVQLISGTCFVALHGKLAVHVPVFRGNRPVEVLATCS